MIDLKARESEGVVEVTVHGKLESIDFEKAGPIVDDMIEHQGKIKGLVLNITDFHGWEGLHALLTHLRFVKAHHRFIERVAAVGDKKWQELLPNLVSHFVKAEPRYFPVEKIEDAREWARGDPGKQAQ